MVHIVCYPYVISNQMILEIGVNGYEDNEQKVFKHGIS